MREGYASIQKNAWWVVSIQEWLDITIRCFAVSCFTGEEIKAQKDETTQVYYNLQEI